MMIAIIKQIGKKHPSKDGHPLFLEVRHGSDTLQEALVLLRKKKS